MTFISSLNEEKQRIIKSPGNILVTANPGTGKTLLLAGKYVSLLKKGVHPEKILCLTFTEKAKNEMKERIIKAIKEEGLKFEFTKLNIFTFHSFCLNHLEEDDIVSSNLLRYQIYKFITENNILDYSDEYLIDIIVPKMENSLRYLKSFNILPKDIKIKEVKKYISDNDKYTKEELDRFAENYLNLFEHYESVKSRKGNDYADLLIKFLQLKKIPMYSHVLVDELQDVNDLEADIALKTGEEFFVVGDKKQAIFGFQGGSILNFEKFTSSKQFVLTENFRSTNEILNYARQFFSISKDSTAKSDLVSLNNPSIANGEMPIVYDIRRNDYVPALCELLSKLIKTSNEIAIISRTNYQLTTIAKALKDRGFDFSSTAFSASYEAKHSIIQFLKGVLSNDISEIKNSMFSPFFPIAIQTAFELSNISDLSLDIIYNKCPAFRDLREKVKTIEDINLLFHEKIFPVAIAYGKEYLYSAIKTHEACIEAVKLIDAPTINDYVIFLRSSDLLSEEPEDTKQITLTTVHKSKGRQFDTVIYLPSDTRENSSFQDYIVEAILKSKGIEVNEELEEEDLRINFVALTRAKNHLHIMTFKPEAYLNSYAILSQLESKNRSFHDFSENRKKAYSLFVNGDFEKAKELLILKEKWLIDYVSNYFKSLDHISVSSLSNSAFEYFTNKILALKTFSKAAEVGSKIHSLAEKIVKCEKIDAETSFIPFIDNINFLINAIKMRYPKALEPEYKLELPLNKLLVTDTKINFFGFIDAIFTNGREYLIVDWKTDRDTSAASSHRQQLECYRRAYAIMNNVPLEKLNVAIGFVGLRSVLTPEKITCLLDETMPIKTSFDTFTKKVNKLLEWKQDTHKFFKDLMSEEKDDNPIWRSLVEQYQNES